MATYQQAQRQYDGQHDVDGDAAAAENEAVAERLSELEKDPDAIEQAINEVDCDHTAELNSLRVMAFLTGAAEDRKALEDRETTLVTAELLKRARNQIADELGHRRSNTAEALVSRLTQRAAA